MKKVFIRIANGIKFTITMEKTKEKAVDIINGKETKKTHLMGIEFILYKFFGLESSSSQLKQDLVYERRVLFCNKLIAEKENTTFSNDDAERLQYLTQILSNEFVQYDSLYRDFLIVLEETGGIDAYRKKPILTPKERQERIEDAKKLFLKLRQKYEQTTIQQ